MNSCTWIAPTSSPPGRCLTCRPRRRREVIASPPRDASGGLGGAKLLRDRLDELPADLAVGDHERTELPEREPVTDEIGRGGDRRGAHAFVDESDLAEMVARTEARPCRAADRDRRVARLDQEERGSVCAFLDHGLAGGEVALLEEERHLR